jgi:hypothetical protein
MKAVRADRFAQERQTNIESRISSVGGCGRAVLAQTTNRER